jgi:4-carboxymuconolactone decarboxylase
MADSERRQRGLELARKLWGDGVTRMLSAGDPLIDISVEHLFGDVWTRPGLALRDRSLVTCAALVALGKDAELKMHLRGLLNQGVSQQEVVEMMIHLAHYAGWPCGVNGNRIAREVFSETAPAPGS